MRVEIQKQRAIRLLKEGKGVEYVTGRYADIGEYMARALKAHVTMGTYDSNTNNKSREQRKISVSKNTLVELLRFGVPEEMILAKCKGIKASNLHAYKAHITRGTYSK